MSMTVAGLCGLNIASRELNAGREQWQPNGRFKNCGVYGDDIPLAKALHWIGKNFTVDLTARVYYNLYALERAGRLSGQRFFGEHDWYREGCEFLSKPRIRLPALFQTRGDMTDGCRSTPASRCSFSPKDARPSSSASSFMELGRAVKATPTGSHRPQRSAHLTEFIAKTNMFGKKPLAWQTYDFRRALEAYRNTYRVNGAEVDAAIVADMKQSPVLYITDYCFCRPIAFRISKIPLSSAMSKTAASSSRKRVAAVRNSTRDSGVGQESLYAGFDVPGKHPPGLDV